jgi:SWI/SNF-related matrix-associated actin-dependent regulator 1 of chromatin subfamily A
MSTGEKDAAVQAFLHNPKIKVFVASIVAAGVGLTLTVSDTVVFCEEAWNPSDVSQAEDRAHRIGQENTVFVYHLVVEGSIDAFMMNKIVAKQEIIDASVNTN